MLCDHYKELDKTYRKKQDMMFCENMFVPSYYKTFRDIHDDIRLRRKRPSCIDKDDIEKKTYGNDDIGLFQVPVTTDKTIKVKECRSCDCRTRSHQLFGNVTKRH